MERKEKWKEEGKGNNRMRKEEKTRKCGHRKE